VAVTATKFDLTFSLQEVPGSLQDLPGQGGLTGAIEYATDLFDAATIARLAAQFRHLAAACAAAPETRIGALPLMDAAERAAVVAGWAPAPPPAARAAETGTGRLDTLVSAAAARHPDRIALRYEGISLTYAALEARANRLAHRLVQLGVGPETRVGLCCERSFEMIVGLLAVLKAGGAYVPLDPEHPDDRLAYMLEDAAPVLVLAQSAQANRLQSLTPPPVLPPARPRPAPSPKPRRKPEQPPKTPPMSSTHQAPPENQRAYASSTGRRCGCSAPLNRCSVSMKPTSGHCSIPSPSTSRSGRCSGRWFMAGVWSSCRAW
jgi:non-ribosomal peptide synthetase component F